MVITFGSTAVDYVVLRSMTASFSLRLLNWRPLLEQPLMEIVRASSLAKMKPIERPPQPPLLLVADSLLTR